MIDKTLEKLIDAAEANPRDVASIMALTDRLSEASPDDRMEAVTRWADMKGRLDGARRGTHDTLRKHSKRLVSREPLPTHVSVEEFREVFVPMLRHDGLRKVGEAMENGRWYALRIDLREQGQQWQHQHWSGGVEFVMTLDAAPLDGGRLDVDGGRYDV